MNNPLSFNRWNYVSSNPINRLDPSGHCYIGSSREECVPYEYELPTPPNINNYDITQQPRNVTFIGQQVVLPAIYKNNGTVKLNTPKAQFIDNNDSYAISHNWPDFKGCRDSQGNLLPTEQCLTHYGLCGQGSIAVILSTRLGVYSLNQVVDDFLLESSHKPFSDERIGEPWPDYTGVKELGQFINLHYGNTINADISHTHVSDWTGNTYEYDKFGNYVGAYGVEKMPPLIKQWSQNNNFVIAGVKVGGSTGVLNGGGASHWVSITGISREWKSENFDSPWNWIRIYNSFNHRQEFYYWPDFRKAWLDDRVPMLLVSPVK